MGTSLTTKSTNFHEWETASPAIFIVGIIRVHSENSCFKCLALGQPGRTSSFGFPADQVVGRDGAAALPLFYERCCRTTAQQLLSG